MNIFEEQSSELFSLAFLLTGDTERSVEAFDRALDYDETENPRELIIGEALGTMATELRTSRQRTAKRAEDEPAGETKLQRRLPEQPRIAREEFEEAVISIDAFPRCAMLLTIFEGMSIRAASALLHADEALTRAVEAIQRWSEGKRAYRFLTVQGDSFVPDEMIARYFAMDTEGAPMAAITKSNYKFRFVTTQGTASVFQITPRRKRLGMIAGEL
jgi:hypothetical protein